MIVTYIIIHLAFIYTTRFKLILALNLKKYKFLFQQLQLTPEGITIHTHRIIIGEIITIYLLFQSDTCYNLKKIKNYINKQTKT